MKITREEALVQFDNLPQSQMLAWGLVQATGSLNELVKHMNGINE